LCVNARDAISGVGRITLETSKLTVQGADAAAYPGSVPGEYVLLSVSDTGCGMEQEVLEHLFEPFFTTKGLGQGTGLGLATVYGVVQQNDGFISVESQPGRGTTFKIYLPRHADKLAQLPKDGPQHSVAGRGRETVLLVEDEPAILRIGTRTLQSLGYTVLALDPAGIGETAPRWGSYSEAWFGQDKVTWLALMVGKPLVGLRMNDILRGLDVLSERNLLPGNQAFGFGRGLVAADLLHAAAVDTRIRGVVLQDNLLSLRSLADTPIQRQIFEAVVPGALGVYDYPDLAAAVAPRPVWIVNAKSPMGQPLTVSEMQAAYRYTAEAYSTAGASNLLQVRRRRGSPRRGGDWSDLGFER
jgi:hypothetical protein